VKLPDPESDPDPSLQSVTPNIHLAWQSVLDSACRSILKGKAILISIIWGPGVLINLAQGHPTFLVRFFFLNETKLLICRAMESSGSSNMPPRRERLPATS
jgi:hypothetical protein